jgi:hypothetical protein
VSYHFERDSEYWLIGRFYSYGYVPLSTDNSYYQQELSRQQAKDMAECRCSNCQVEKGQSLIQNLKKINKQNFDAVVGDKISWPALVSSFTHKQKYTCQKATTHVTINEELGIIFAPLKVKMFALVREMYEFKYGSSGRFLVSDLFNNKHVNSIVNQIQAINSEGKMWKKIGGETVSGQVKVLYECVENFRSKQVYHDYLKKLKETQEEELEQKRKVRRLNAAQYQANTCARKAFSDCCTEGNTT